MRFAWILIGLGLAILLLVPLSAADTAHAQEVQLVATLSGDNEVPPVTTDASGTFTATLNAERTELSFKLVVSNMVGVTQAHPHCGVPGQVKPIFAFFFGEGMVPGDKLPTPPPTTLLDPGVDVDGVLSTGTLTADNLIGDTPCAASFDAAVDALLNGGVYVNVHTEAYPPGAIRGQVTVVEAPPAAVPVTGGAPPADEDGFAWWYLFIAAGVLALVGGGALTLRRFRA